MTRQITPARQILGELLNGNRIPLVPVEGTSGIRFEFKGIASIGRLVTGRAKGLVSPTGPVKEGTSLLFHIHIEQFVV
jgi:hypothetical protein